MRIKVLAILSALTSLMSSCVEEIDVLDHLGSDEVVVYFDLMLQNRMRSSISPDEEAVRDVNFFVYQEDMIVNHIYVDDMTTAAMTLNVGEEYSIYALANVGEVSVYPSLEDLIAEYKFSLDSIYEMDGYLPYTGIVKSVRVTDSGQRFSIPMERMVAKINLNIESSSIDGLEICSARLCQCAMTMTPFLDGGSAALSVSDVSDGDYCTESDLGVLNAGGQVCFYALENCQGVLLPENTDPWKKIPASMNSKSELCTYLELSCRFDGSGLYQGEVMYRLYLGQDNCSDFSIERNTILNVTLSLTNDGLKRDVAWRVDPDYAVRDGYVSGWISKGMHGEYDLYVGERFEYSLSFTDEMLEHLGGDLSDCRVIFRPYDQENSTAISFSQILSDENFVPYVKATCMLPSEGDICLADINGEVLAVLSENVSISLPFICLSDVNEYGESDVVTDLGTSFECGINGEVIKLGVYFLDSQGYNLNLSSGCGYELDLFDFQLSAHTSSSESVLSSFIYTSTPGISSDNGPVLNVSMMCSNNGTDHGLNMDLLNMCVQANCINLNLTESNFDYELPLSSILYYLPIDITLVDNGWAGYSDDDYAVVINNPSNLPLEVSCWQFLTTDSECDDDLRASVLEMVENELILDRMEYVATDYNISMMPVYGSNKSFISERNSYGDDVLEKDGKLIYGMDGICTDDIIAALTYDGLGHNSLSHHLDVKFTDGTSIANLTVNDCLSDGTQEYADKYSFAGLNDRGVWIYEGRNCILSPESMFDSYPGLSPSNLEAMRNQIPVIGVMSYDMNDGQLYIVASTEGSDGLFIDSKCEARADGYVRTYPNGTWGAAVDNYCSEELVRYSLDIPMSYSNDGNTADEGTVRSIFEMVYENKYYDSWNKIGSANNYQHRAHPTSLEMMMFFKLSDGYDNEAYLFYPKYQGEVKFYHTQEGVEYDVPSEFSYRTFNFIEVTRR